MFSGTIFNLGHHSSFPLRLGVIVNVVFFVVSHRRDFPSLSRTDGRWIVLRSFLSNFYASFVFLRSTTDFSSFLSAGCSGEQLFASSKLLFFVAQIVQVLNEKFKRVDVRKIENYMMMTNSTFTTVHPISCWRRKTDCLYTIIFVTLWNWTQFVRKCNKQTNCSWKFSKNK